MSTHDARRRAHTYIHARTRTHTLARTHARSHSRTGTHPLPLFSPAPSSSLPLCLPSYLPTYLPHSESPPSSLALTLALNLTSCFSLLFLLNVSLSPSPSLSLSPFPFPSPSPSLLLPLLPSPSPRSIPRSPPPLSLSVCMQACTRFCAFTYLFSLQTYARLLQFPARAGRPAHLLFYEDLKRQPEAVPTALSLLHAHVRADCHSLGRRTGPDLLACRNPPSTSVVARHHPAPPSPASRVVRGAFSGLRARVRRT